MRAAGHPVVQGVRPLTIGHRKNGRVAALTADLRERIRRLAGMERLLPALDGLPPTYLVGGAVRDLLRGAAAVDLDIAVEGDARSVARALAERLGGMAASTSASAPRPCARRRSSSTSLPPARETYAEPGRAAARSRRPALVEDLRRRDFTRQRHGGRRSPATIWATSTTPTAGSATWRPASFACSTSG